MVRRVPGPSVSSDVQSLEEAQAAQAGWRSRIVGSGTMTPAELLPNPSNWRKHGGAQQRAMTTALDQVGWVQRVIVNRTTGHLVDGHMRVALALERQEDGVPVVFVELTPDEEAMVLASLDPLGTMASPDPAQLERLLAMVKVPAGELRQLLADVARGAGLDRIKPGAIDPDDLVPARPLYVEPGQLWRLGQHRLLVGDSRDAAAVARLTGGEPVDLVWTDPPYGVSYVGGSGMTIENDDLDPAALGEFLMAALGNAKEALRPGGAIYVAAPGGAQGWAFVDVMVRLGLYRQTIVWVKDVFVLGRQDYQWRHELVHLGVQEGRGVKVAAQLLVGWRRGAAHYFVPDRTQDTVWEIPRPRASAEHPTMKPVELVRRCLSFSSRKGDRVLDLFTGSGTTLIAAQEIGRVGLGMELDPVYAQATIERWQAFAGANAELLD